MSDQTRADLEAAISAHVGDESGHMVTGWVLSCSTAIPADGDVTGYHHEGPEGQPIHSTLGLVEMARRYYGAAVDGALRGDDDV